MSRGRVRTLLAFVAVVAIAGAGCGATHHALWLTQSELASAKEAKEFPDAPAVSLIRSRDFLFYFGTDASWTQLRHHEAWEIRNESGKALAEVRIPLPGTSRLLEMHARTVTADGKIVELTRKTGLKYMMMETVVYAREYLYIKELYDKGELGKIQFLQASHQQDMDGWPNYWPGLPPMWYATHCVGPMLALTDATAEYVSCFGSGTIRKELVKHYGSTFAVEPAHVKFKDSDLSARIIRSLFDTARQYRESIDVYGSKKSFEWSLIEHEPHVLHTAKKPEHKIPQKVKVPDYAHRLPRGIRKFTTKGVYDLGKKTHLSFTQGAGHGGSHPHLAHEFISALVEGRQPYPNAKKSANWTCVGLCAHESALAGGKIAKLPAFTL